MPQLIAYPLIVEDGSRLKEHSIIIKFMYQNLTEMITGNEPINSLRAATGQPYFKSGIDKDVVENQIYSGLTIRQHFAAMAMQGMLANPEIKKDIKKDHQNIKDIMEIVALNAMDAADALIAELNKP